MDKIPQPGSKQPSRAKRYPDASLAADENDQSENVGAAERTDGLVVGMVLLPPTTMEKDLEKAVVPSHAALRYALEASVTSSIAPMEMPPPPSDALPGAYPVAGVMPEQDFSLSQFEDEIAATPLEDPPRDAGNMAVANLVQDQEVVARARREISYRASRQSRQEKRNQQQLRRVLFISVAVVIVLAVVLVSIFLALVPSETETLPPTSAPSQPPPVHTTMPMGQYVLSLLPDYTRKSIEEDMSPQAKAYDWLMDGGGEYLPFLADHRILQRFALACLYFATNGPRWNMNDNWLDHSVHECHWYSKYKFLDEGEKDYRDRYNATGNTNQRHGYFSLCGLDLGSTEESGVLDLEDAVVQHLLLPQNQLQGTLPPELFLLSDLDMLYLDHQPIGGTIPSGIAKLSRLQFFSMIGCGLTGTIPTETSPDVLPALLGMLLAGNQLTGTIPSYLGGFETLHQIQLSLNNFTGTIPSELGLLSDSLHILDLSLNPNLDSTIPTEIGLLNKARKVILGNSNLQGPIPSEMGLLRDAQQISLDHNLLSGTVPSELTSLVTEGKLQVLHLNNNSLVGTVLDSLCSIDAVFDCTNQMCGCNCNCSNN